MINQEKSTTVLKRADISTRAASTPDLEGRYPQIVAAIAEETGFTPDPKEEPKKSTWWGKKVGAVIYKGKLPIEGKATPAILKIEAIQMQPDELTETTMIHKAEVALAGSDIRPPKVYRELPWTTDHQGYSAIFEEAVPTDHPVLPVPGTEHDIAALLDVRERYRHALQTNHVVPWVALDFPDETTYLSRFVRTKFEAWKQSSKDTFPNHPFREPTDVVLIDRAIAMLEKGYERILPEFQQGHFSHRDIVRVEDEMVIFSNLYWSWRAPFYDAVFASHWYMYELANAKGITIEQIEQQREIWDRQYAKMLETLSPADKKLFALARIERLAAGLNIDALSISQDPQNEIARYMVNQTRNDLLSSLEKIA